jgi:hypothetical protein
MRFRDICRIIFLGLLILSFGLTLTIMAEEKTVQTEFVDLDGDGIDDNETDNDGNNIPDCFEGKDVNFEPVEVRSILGNVFNSEKSLKDPVDLRTNTDKFGSLAFKARGLPQRCCGFGTEDEFGSESGLGISSGGGACAGGVCVR